MSHNIMQAQPSGSAVSKVESDIAQTLSLADTIVILIREPAAWAYQAYGNRQAIRRSIGDWKKEAFDEDKECRIPALKCTNFDEDELGEFEKYLVKHDGILKPDGKLPAKSSWAYLMHALGIKPGDGLVEWRPSLDGYIRTQNDEIEMEIAGSAFFTVVNLFTIDGMMDEADVERVKRPEEIRSVRLEFGRLAWAEQGNEIHARFQPGTETEINSTKLPFHRVRSNMEPGTFITSYLNALQNGITHSDLVLPDHTATLETRVKTFSNALRVIKDGRSLKDPILVTYGWLQSATRIIKRLLANGGEDQSFYEDVCRTCEATIPPQVKQRPGALDDMKDRIRKEFLFGEDVPSFYVEKPKRNGVTPPSNRGL